MRYFNSQNIRADLASVYEQDQIDHASFARSSEIEARDRKHRDFVLELLSRNQLKSADELFAAAMVLQHGNLSSDFEHARDLCAQAIQLDPDFSPAKALFAAATDRHLHSLGKPQIYGTQAQIVNGRWTMEPFDPNSITASEREAHGVDVAQTQAMVERMNAGMTTD